MKDSNFHGFHDINKFPKGYGILVFPISIARAEYRNGQDHQQCFEYMQYFSPNKINETKVGLNMIYGDFLYLHSKERASLLKEKFMNIVLQHKRAFQKLIEKNTIEFQIQTAFSYEVWNQLYLDYQGDFGSYFKIIKSLYAKDQSFQKYVKEDAAYCRRELTDEQTDFFLEEHLMLLSISKKKVLLPNEYVGGREKWVLWCYPGVPLKSQIYVYQQNFLKLDAPENIYQNCFYDLEAKKLVDFTKIDLEKYTYTYE